ncbi:MAG TPA: LamG domain-containing protein [Ferruginibacter sp.]|jgi:hypothetical protein|nr:LamG domain-containing protein [Ferruginibacter sp.]
MKSLYLLPLLFVAACSPSRHIRLTKGLAAYYPFNGNAYDSSKNKNNPVFNNATLTADRFGNVNSAYHFNGIDNYIDIPNSQSLNMGKQISLCAWVRPTGFYAGTCHGNSILQKADYRDPGCYVMDYDDGLFRNAHHCDGMPPDTTHETFGGKDAPEATPYIIPGQWHFFVYTNDGVKAKVYVNGRLRVSYPSTHTIYTNKADLLIGSNVKNNDAYPFWVNADIDEIRIYNRAINQKEVDSLMKTP